MGKTYPRVVKLLNNEVPLKVSRYAFCKETGINPTAFDRYKAGTSEPNQSTLEKLSRYFKFPVAYLRGDYEGEYGEPLITEKQARDSYFDVDDPRNRVSTAFAAMQAALMQLDKEVKIRLIETIIKTLKALETVNPSPSQPSADQDNHSTPAS